MKNSKLIKLLRLFDSQETKQLKKFVSKMNSDEALPKLFEFLVKKAPHFEYKKEQCYQAVFPERSYSDAALRKLFAKGIQLTEQFIISIRIQKSDLLKNRALSEFYMEKEATGLWEKQMTRWEQANQKNEWNFHFLEKIRMAEYQFRYYSTQKSKELSHKSKKNQTDALIRMLLILEQFMIQYLFCFKNLSISVNNNYSKNLAYNLTVIDKAVSMLTALDEKVIKRYQASHFCLFLNWKAYNLLSTHNHEHYIELKQFLYQNHQNIPKDNIIALTNYMTYYCFHHYEKVGQIEQKEPLETFEIYKFMLEQKLCHKGKYLLPMAYLSLFNLAFEIGKTDWLKYFIDTYSKDLPPKEQFHLTNFCTAFYHFKLKDFNLAIKHLELLEQKNSHYSNFEAKIRLLMAYYEVEHDRFEASINAVRVMLFRDQKHAGIRIESHKSFLNYLFQIYNCPKGDKENLEKLRPKIEIADPLARRGWLLEKLSEKIGNA